MPTKPLLIYDGNCGFCKIWIDYWRKLTGDRVEYAPSQEVGDQYPQIPKEEFGKAVQLVRPDGSVAGGAEAVFETLRHEKIYALFPAAWEWGYGVIARHRDFFYYVTRRTLGTRIEPARFVLTQWLFLRLLAAIYAIAFASLSVQVTGLLGTRGILPVADYLKAVTDSVGGMRFYEVPTLFWMNSSNAALLAVCYAGVALSALLFAGFFERVALAGLFILYLSLSAAGQEFLSFQWDSLLLEAGFLAIFLGHFRIVAWLYRWLVFRLMFLSGSVKLLSHDKTWSDFTALEYHYFTQPLPTRISWYMAQLPAWFQIMSTGVVLATEVGVPFLIFAPRRMRVFGAKCLLLLQLLIFLTGNYTFFNLLAAALCVFLFDDRSFERWLKPRLAAQARSRKIEKWTVAAVAVLVSSIGVSRMADTFTESPPNAIVRYTAPFEIVNSYGLFAVMTTERLEIVMEGSMDGETWIPYTFRFKPGELNRPPRWAAPYQPRLDWQMWFAALGNYRENPWFINFAVRLLEGSPDVLGLLGPDPFHGRTPQYVRGALYDYSFTDFRERRRTGNWWKREDRGFYLPPVGLKRMSLLAPLK